MVGKWVYLPEYAHKPTEAWKRTQKTRRRLLLVKGLNLARSVPLFLAEFDPAAQFPEVDIDLAFPRAGVAKI